MKSFSLILLDIFCHFSSIVDFQKQIFTFQKFDCNLHNYVVELDKLYYERHLKEQSPRRPSTGSDPSDHSHHGDKERHLHRNRSHSDRVASDHYKGHLGQGAPPSRLRSDPGEGRSHPTLGGARSHHKGGARTRTARTPPAPPSAHSDFKVFASLFRETGAQATVTSPSRPSTAEYHSISYANRPPRPQLIRKTR